MSEIRYTLENQTSQAREAWTKNFGGRLAAQKVIDRPTRLRVVSDIT